MPADPFLEELLLATVIILAVASSIALWAWMLLRWRRRKPVLPYEPRRPVPWGGIHIAMVLLVYVFLQSAVITAASAILGDAASLPDIYNPDETSSAHPIAQLIAGRGVWLFLACGLAVVVITPIAEEFFFRLLLQGWLEAFQRRWRRQMPTLRRIFRGGSGPIVLSSLVFARMHFRVSGPAPNVDFVIYALMGGAVANLLTMVFALGLLRGHARATAADLGWSSAKFATDVRLGLLAFVAIAPPVYAVQVVLSALLPKYLAPDPFPLFLLAVALGTIYFRTHRLAPSVVVHAALNAASLLMAWLATP